MNINTCLKLHADNVYITSAKINIFFSLKLKLSKTPQAFFAEVDKLNLQFFSKGEETRIARTIF